MLDTLRKAMVAHKVNEVKQEFQRVGSSLQALMLQPDIFDRLEGHTAWSLVHGMDAALNVLEQSTRDALRSEQPIDGDVTRTLREVQSAMATLRASLSSMLPLVESKFGMPPTNTRWTINRPTT